LTIVEGEKKVRRGRSQKDGGGVIVHRFDETLRQELVKKQATALGTIGRWIIMPVFRQENLCFVIITAP
jgi:hypothetical protein